MEKQIAEAAFFRELYFNGWIDIVNFSGFLYIDWISITTSALPTACWQSFLCTLIHPKLLQYLFLFGCKLISQVIPVI